VKFMPRTGRGVIWRALLAGVVVIACAAGATATVGLLQVSNLVTVLSTGKALSTEGLKPPAPGKPETVLLVGVDHRYGEGKTPGNTDTMLLLRIDDKSSTINALSIPRDLQVDIPGYGLSKLNAAYTIGGKNGSTLLVETLKKNLFPHLSLTHIFVTDFSSFARLITSIGCVYVPVDRHYFNHSIGLADLDTDYSSIDIQPGYQKLCGNGGGADSALAFVRFRHNDSDLVRESRQQDFLEWAKDQFGASKLFAEKTKLLHLFAKDVSSDKYFHSTDGLIDLFNLAYNADGTELKSIPFPVGPAIGGTTNLSYSPSAVARAYKSLMTPTPLAAGQKAIAPVIRTDKTSKKTRNAAGPPPAPAGMAADPGDGSSQAAQLGHNVGLPIYYPRNIPDDYSYCFSETGNCNIYYEPSTANEGSYPRAYVLRDTSDKPHKSYVMTLVESYNGETELASGQYISVQGTTWTDPPILKGTHTIRRIDGKTLDIYGQAGKVALVAWRRGGAVYWIANTLQNAAPNPQMIAMAESFARANG
jgi:LCP family protein required for cell wall assembly